MPATAPYGSWKSPIRAQDAAAHGGRPGWAAAVGEEVWWTEPRPVESGRTALVRLRGGEEVDVLPAPWNVRNRVHEYGGRAWAARVLDDGPLLVFTDFADQRLYRHRPDRPGARPEPLTPVPELPAGLRYAAPVLVGDQVWCIREAFHGTAPDQLSRDLVAVPLDGTAAEDPSRVRVLRADHRFVTEPKPSPDGRRAAWIAWEHPAMPWDGTRVRVAEVLPDGAFGEPRTVAGGPEESVCQVEWAPDGSGLLLSTDRSGWWNLELLPSAALDPGAEGAAGPRPLVPEAFREEEFGGPLWDLGLRWFAPLSDGRIAVVHGRGEARLGLLDPARGTLAEVAGPWTEWVEHLDSAPAADGGGRLIGVAASPATGFEVIEVAVPADGPASARVVGRPHRDAVDPAYLPEPEARTFPGPGGREVHAVVYPPRNPEFTAPGGELPPYVVVVHGGPTSRRRLVPDLEVAWFTSRGLGVVEVNYGGSTGYGREYRNRLRENWGVVDVEDCAAAVLGLAAEGAADRGRLGIRGGSAGGWTSGASIVFSPETYACAAIYFPIFDLSGWSANETHDFESHYLESLVGPLPESGKRYRDRSPVNHADRVQAPFVLLQGLEDAICPPVQCERFLDRMAGRGVPHVYLAFEGEGHGFRRAETTIACLRAELALYARVFGFRPADPEEAAQPGEIDWRS